MTQGEDKKLLFIDLCSRLPYHVRLKIWLKDGTTEEGFLDLEHNYADVLRDAFYYNKIIDIKPYLRPLSSMTEEEHQDWIKYSKADYDCEFKPEPTFSLEGCHLSIDWLNAHHFDYRGLLEKGLAIEASEGMYNIKEK